MPKHITLSRRKQSAPLDLDAFKEKRSVREQAKKASKASAAVKPIDVDEEAVEAEAVPVNDVVKKRKNEKKDTSSKKARTTKISDDNDQQQEEEEEDNIDDVIDFDDDDDDDNGDAIEASESSSLSAADVRNEFEALQSKIELGLEDANKLAKQMVQPAKKSAAASTNPDDAPDMQPGVLYIGHLPFGFHERQIEGFLSQFGEVLRVKLARSKRTGGSRHFAFIEFRRLYVAKVVVEAMNGYIMYRRRLACAIVPPEKCHARMWSISRNIVKSQSERRARSQIAYGAAVLDESKAAASEQRRAERAKARADKLAAAGFDLEAIKQKAKQTVTTTTTTTTTKKTPTAAATTTKVKTPVAATKKTPKRK